MKNSIKTYFTIWWMPLLSYLLILLIFVIGTILKRDWIINLFLIFFLINVIGNLISSVTQIIIKKWYYLIPQLIITVFLVFYIIVVFTFSPPDYYGAHKTIPKNIEIYEPMEIEPKLIDFKNHDLIISCSFQPGIYNYHTDYLPYGLGHFFIKAFEINSNDQLSKDRMRERSNIEVTNSKLKMYSGEIMIYEGSWGDKYGTRIELWFAPKNGEDYKITQRNYIIEGWMR